MNRQKIVAGNWKMNLTSNQATELTSSIIASFDQSLGVKLILCPPYPFLTQMASLVADQPSVFIGAQNSHHLKSGAFTGEVSAEMIQSTGAQYVILGHSERRTYFKESDELINQKIKLALQNQLIPIFCCGEVLEDRELNHHEAVVQKQILDGFAHLSKEDIAQIVIAYEPVWAIGTGKTASPQQAQDMHFFIRTLMINQFGTDIPILYGGSCKPDNAKELFAMPDIDGGLIGGASLIASDFIKIASSW
jgi:triosephosphate isomerase (TIM)